MLLQRYCRAIYEAMLHVYPRPFRKRFGKEMLQVFDQRFHAAMQTSGPIGLIRFAACILRDLLSSAVAETIDSLRLLPRFAIAVDREYAGVPVFFLCGSDAPRAPALMAGAILSLALFNSATFTIEYGRARFWRNDLTMRAHQSRFWASGWPALVPSVYAAGPAQTQKLRPVAYF